MKQLGLCLFWAGFSGGFVACGGNEIRSSDWSDDEPSNDDDIDDRTFAGSPSSANSSGRSTAANTGASDSATAADTGTATSTTLGTATNSTQTSQDMETGSQTREASNACGNGKVDAGEECDNGPSNSDTRAGACRTSCQQASCGDGVRDEGESCDTGTQNSDTESDSCRSDCSLPRCGDGVVDVGRSEACDGTLDCGTRCTIAECGDNVVEGEEECEPGIDTNCDDDCALVSGASVDEQPDESDTDSDVSSSEPDSDYEPTEQQPDESDEPPQDESDDSDEQTSTSDDMNEEGDVLFDFESGAQGWVLYETSPESLASTTQVAHDGGNGENGQGALKLYGPFDASDQKLEAQVSFDPPRDLSGQIVHAKARLSSGLSLDRENPGGIKLFVKTGANYSYAAGAFVALTEGFGWVEFTVAMDDPELVFEADEYDPTQVRQIGIELRTFEQTTEALPATVYVDSIKL